MGPDPTRAYFWPTVNKRLTRLWLGYFLTRPEDIFLPEGKKIEKFDISGENFQTQTIDVWLDPSYKELIWPNPG